MDEPKLEFTDKRRVRIDDEAPAEPGSAPEAVQEAEPEGAPEHPDAAGMAETETLSQEPAGTPEDLGALPADEETAEDFLPMDVYSLLRSTVQLMASGAWAWMGLTPSPFTGKMERDLAQARVAIDTVAYLVGQLDPQLAEEERRELQNMISMLRVNYVQQMQKP